MATLGRYRLRTLTRTRRGWRVYTLGCFPDLEAALYWANVAGGSSGRWWLELRTAPASQWR